MYNLSKYCICIKRFGCQRKYTKTLLHNLVSGPYCERTDYCVYSVCGMQSPDLTDAFPSVFRVHGQHGDVATTEHLLVHVELTYNGSDTLLLHHGLWQTHTQQLMSTGVVAESQATVPLQFLSLCQFCWLSELTSDLYFMSLPLMLHASFQTNWNWEV